MNKPLLAGLAIMASGTGAMFLMPAPSSAQWSTVYEQIYLPASHNWAFRRNFNSAERLFYAFDYGHAILYETLWNSPNAPASLLEEVIYDRLTKRILVRPPHVPLEEGAIEIAYAKLAPEAKVMFDWAHVLHRQVYDIWADERVPLDQKDARVAEVLAYYKSRPDIAFSSRPKSMDLMDGQYYSLAFREGFPKFNGLIWGYHWLQIGLYEPIMLGRNSEERQALVRATVARFWQMLENPPETMPYLMPMTAAVAPTFAERYPEVAIIFDNLHMMHDVISDILVSPEVPRNRKREEILRAAAAFRDDTTHVTTADEWRQMALAMGVENQGGPAVGFLTALPRTTVARGMSMAGMDHGEMGHSAGEHAAPADAGPDPHAGHQAPGADAQPAHDAQPGHMDMQGMQGMQRMMEMHERMLADPVIRERSATDPVLRHMMDEMAPMMEMHPPAPGMTEAEMHQSMEFILRLFADPAVAARVRADPRLNEIWTDPQVQQHLQMMREMHEAPATEPTSDGAREPPPGQPAPHPPQPTDAPHSH